MKPISGKEMCKILKRHGWLEARITGSHHIFKKPGAPKLVPVPDHGTKTLKPRTQNSIMHDADLTDADL